MEAVEVCVEPRIEDARVVREARKSRSEAEQVVQAVVCPLWRPRGSPRKTSSNLGLEDEPIAELLAIVKELVPSKRH